MLSASGIRTACPKCRFASAFARRGTASFAAPSVGSRETGHLLQRSGSSQFRAIGRSFSSTRRHAQGNQPVSSQGSSPSKDEIERIVREAKQRFRDTLPKNYLNDEEYALYERLYGPPLRETSPEDVGIPMHADMGEPAARPANERTLIRELEGGVFEEVSYEVAMEAKEAEEDQVVDDETVAEDTLDVAEKAPGYVDFVARSQREHDALLALQKDFEAARAKQKETEDEVSDEEESHNDAEAQAAIKSSWPAETMERLSWVEDTRDESPRYHPYTVEGRFHDSPIELEIPQEELVQPIREMLERTHLGHVKKAAESAFGGRGLPTSPATPSWLKTGQMTGVGLPPDQRHMTEIEADAFLAGYMAPAYASVMSILKEVRRRVGSDWLQSRLMGGKESELSVLDAGSGGAALVAWDRLLQAEWTTLHEKGEVSSSEKPSSKKSAVIASDRLRHRTKAFLDNTSFLPRLPDYEHSGEMQGERLDGGGQSQARKSYDVVIASHLFLNEKQGYARDKLLNKIWSLVNPNGGVLVVLEKAHPRGFEAMADVRETALKHFLLPQDNSPSLEEGEVPRRELEPGYVIAPCPNQAVCPMYIKPGKSSGRKDFCHFSQRFVRPTFYSAVVGDGAHQQGEVEFSYVAIRRGEPQPNPVLGDEATAKAFEGYEESDEKPDMNSLPRLTRPALKRKSHVTMDVCTPQGTSERWTVPKSFSRLAYHDARKSKWGDLWALGAKTRVPANLRLGAGIDMELQLKREKEDRKRRPRQAQQAMLERQTPEAIRLAKHEAIARKTRRSKTLGSRKERTAERISEMEALEESLIEKEIEEEVRADLEEERMQEEERRGGGGRRGRG